MKLEDKGAIRPAPVLSKHPEEVSRAIQQWEAIVSATHWDLYDTSQVDGADFYVDEQELGHIHLNGEIHLATNSVLSALLIKMKLAEKFPYGSGWVQYQIADERSAAHALWLFRLNYDRLKGLPISDLQQRIEQYVGPR